MNKLSVLILAMGIGTGFTTAYAGDKAGNGGDPMTSQMIAMAKRLSMFYKDNPFNLQLPFKPEEFSKRVEVLDNSLKEKSARHLVEFTNATLHDVNNVEKPAVYEIKDNPDEVQIRFNRKNWRKFSGEQRLVQINLEIFGIMHIKDRYRLAQDLVKDHSAVILAIPLSDDNAYHKDGWRMVGQDADLFGRVTEEDFWIDGKTVGEGSELNKRLEAFLTNPAGEKKDWLSGISSSWQKGRPGFILMNRADGNNASITAVMPMNYNHQRVLQAYSLLFTKFRQIYQGPCAEDAKTLTTVERLKNCYLDQSNYYSREGLVYKPLPEDATVEQGEAIAIEVLKDLHEELLRFYANDGQNLTVALRDYFVTDYSPTVPGYEVYFKNAAALAFGLEPTLEGPFERVPFWKQTGKKNVKNIRLYNAGRALAQNNLVYLDQNARCGSFEGPILVPTEQSRNTRCIYTRMGVQFPGPLYEAMVAHGFRYDYAKQTWFLLKK